MSTHRHTRRRSLRVALVQDGRILQDRIFAPGRAGVISLSRDTRDTRDTQHTLVMPASAQHIPGEEGFEIRPSSKGRHHTLRLSAHFTGKLRIQNRNFYLQDLLASGLARPSAPAQTHTTHTDDGLPIAQPTAELEIGPGDWGMLHIGAFDIIFQYVDANAVSNAAPARSPGWLRNAAQHLGSPLGLGMLVGLMAQSSLMFWMSTQEEPSLEQLVEHSAEDRLSASQSADQETQAATLQVTEQPEENFKNAAPVTASDVTCEALSAAQTCASTTADSPQYSPQYSVTSRSSEDTTAHRTPAVYLRSNTLMLQDNNLISLPSLSESQPTARVNRTAQAQKTQKTQKTQALRTFAHPHHTQPSVISWTASTSASASDSLTHTAFARSTQAKRSQPAHDGHSAHEVNGLFNRLTL